MFKAYFSDDGLRLFCDTETVGGDTIEKAVISQHLDYKQLMTIRQKLDMLGIKYTITEGAVKAAKKCKAPNFNDEKGHFVPYKVTRYQISQLPTLDDSDEKELARRIAKGDSEALELLITCSLRFVASTAFVYRNICDESLLFSAGYSALFKAAENFDPERGVRFATFARHYIVGAFYAEMADSNSIHIPKGIRSEIKKVKNYKDNYFMLHGKYPSAEEIVDALNFKNIDLLDILESIITMLPLDDGSDEPIIDIIQDFSIDNEETRDTHLVIEEMLAKLSPEERLLLEYRFGLHGRELKTLTELGDMFNITKQAARNRLIKLLKKLRDDFGDDF